MDKVFVPPKEEELSPEERTSSLFVLGSQGSVAIQVPPRPKTEAEQKVRYAP